MRIGLVGCEKNDAFLHISGGFFFLLGYYYLILVLYDFMLVNNSLRRYQIVAASQFKHPVLVLVQLTSSTVNVDKIHLGERKEAIDNYISCTHEVCGIVKVGSIKAQRRKVGQYSLGGARVDQVLPPSANRMTASNIMNMA